MVRQVIPFVAAASFCIINAPVFADGMLPAGTLAAPVMVTQQAPVQTRDMFVRSITSQVLNIIHNPASTLNTKKAQLESTFLQVADVPWIAAFVIGDAWNSATPQQRGQYVSLYGKYLTGMYLAGLTEESQKNLRDIQVLSLEDAYEDAFIVHTQMLMAQGNNVKVDYLVREENGQRKVVDIVLEGVSMLQSHHSELGGLASAKGLDSVIVALQDKMSKGETHVAARSQVAM